MSASPPPIPPKYYGYPAPVPQRQTDESHLRTLMILHYVWAGLAAATGCMGFLYIMMGSQMKAHGWFPGKVAGTQATMPIDMANFMGGFMVIMGIVLIAMGWTQAILNFISARGLARRRGRIFSIVVSGINCLNMPLGTALGVFTILALSRPSVKEMYAEAEGGQGG